MHAISYQQVDICFLTCVHHLLPFLCIYSHWFFADNVLAGCSNAYCLVVMKAIDHSELLQGLVARSRNFR